MDKRQKIIELDTLFQEIARESSCRFYALLPNNITPTQFVILKIISDSNKCKAADIAHVLDISPAAATNMVERLYKNEWIKRTRSEEDRRIVWLELTEEGKNLLMEIENKKYNLLLEEFKSITNEELIMLSQVFGKILAKLKDN